jgi:hypothetical protein
MNHLLGHKKHHLLFLILILFYTLAANYFEETKINI